MTLDVVVQQPAYWLALVALVTGAKIGMRIAASDFRMIAVLILSQFVAHAAVATGLSLLFWFCFAFWLCFVLPVSLLTNFGRLAEHIPPPSALDLDDKAVRADVLEAVWGIAARGYLAVYWVAHLIMLPPNFGVVAVAERLEQMQSAKLLAFGMPLVLPALAACMWIWLRRGYRLRWWDLAPLALSLIGMLGSTSKVNLLPVLLAFLGAVALRRKPWREMRVGLALAALALAALVARLVLYFPGGNPAAAAQTIAFRFAAATDSLDYLIRGHLAPSDYPYAGPAALLPFLTKRLGYDYKYGPGVWLYGEVRGSFAGYGPNPGIVMDYFANIGWFSLVFPVVISLLAFLLARRPSAPVASLLAVVWFAWADLQLFEVAVFPQLLVLGALVLVIRLLDRTHHLRVLHRRLSRSFEPSPGAQGMIARLRARRFTPDASPPPGSTKPVSPSLAPSNTSVHAVSIPGSRPSRARAEVR